MKLPVTPLALPPKKTHATRFNIRLVGQLFSFQFTSEYTPRTYHKSHQFGNQSSPADSSSHSSVTVLMSQNLKPK
ncbi:hypothetical protein SCA6_007981 [Theobroma cacao]